MSTLSLEEEETEEFEEDEEQEEEEESKEQEEVTNEKPQTLSVLQSIDHLQTLHSTLSDFLRHYNALQQTLDSINSSLGPTDTKPQPTKSQDQEEQEQSSELESICRHNAARSLRKYIATHLPEIDRLRREVPEALKLSPNPARLVLDAVGRFYLQGSRAYDRPDSQAVESRRAGILLLEFYVLAGFPEVENDSYVGKISMDAAFDWRRRILGEGDIQSASPVDALGLVLLLASFGVPPGFKTKDLYTFLRLSNLRKKADVFRRSTILLKKMPDIIKDMITKDMSVEAVDLICAFGLEDKFSPLPLLLSFVKKAYEDGVQEIRKGQCSIRALREAPEKQLAKLKSVVKCLEDHKLDASEVDQINQKIAMLENEILEREKMLQENNIKRRLGDVESLEKPYNQAKRPRPASAETSHGNGFQGSTALSDSRYVYNDFVGSNMSVTAETSYGVIDRSGMRLLAGNFPGPAGAWHGNGVAAYQNSVGHSFSGMSYPSRHDLTGYSAAAAAAAQNFYQPPASSHGNGAANLYQFADTVSERDASTATNPGH